MSSPPFVELSARSAFSFLEGSSAPEDLVARAAELGHGALALADSHGVYGLPRFHRAARAAGVQAICGARVHLWSETRRRRKSDPPPDGGRVTLLAKDRAGYKNLCKLLTLGHARVEKPHCRVGWDELREHASGLVALVRAPPLAGPLQKIFGADAFGELWRHRDPDEERANRTLLATGIAPLATGDVRHAAVSGKRLLDAFTCIAHGVKLEEAGRVLLPNAERHLHAADEMARRFADLPLALANTLEVAERCAFRLEDLGYEFPDFPSGGESLPALLRRLAFEGARERYGGQVPEQARAQLEHELGIIGRLELEGYFLIVWDVVRECRARGILCQGRGSAANSIVCYALGITAIDPVRYELLFERFLSEERGEWPDIDVDLPSGDHREEILQYVYQRYGAAGAGMTANVITYRAKSAVREMGKLLGFANEQIDRLAKLLSRHEFTDEHDALERQLRDAGMHPGAQRVQHLLRLVHEAQNLPRHLGQHSGGMVIAKGRLDEVVPLEPARMPGRTVIQWDKDDCADLGIIKIDLLGLGMMAVLEDAIPLVRAHDAADVALDKIPANDPKTYAMLQAADTTGVFQVESRAQMATLPRMKPTSFYDLVVEVAIIRPGPITGEMVQPYLQRRAGREKVSYAHPELEPILKRTLGVPLFQEQLLRMAMTIAGFSGGEAEELRRAMGFKRSVERMDQIVRKLRAGMTQKGVSPAAQEEIVKQIGSFALYGFPESHAASFALLAYASAYIRAHHPACFLAAMLNHWPLGFYSPATLVQDAQRHGVHVLPIDVQESDWLCHVTAAGEVRLGLRYVDGLRQDAGERIASESPYESLADLAARTQLHRDELEKLGSIGACASLGLERREALWQIAALSGGILAGAESTTPSPLAEMTPFETTVADYRGTGITTGAHLMSHFRGRLRERGVLSAAELRGAKHGSWVRIAGAVIVRQRPGTAKGFLFLTLEDETGTSNAIVIPDVFHRHRAVVQSSGILLVEGPVQSQDGVIHVRARSFERLDGEGMRELLPRSHDFR